MLQRKDHSRFPRLGILFPTDQSGVGNNVDQGDAANLLTGNLIKLLTKLTEKAESLKQTT